MCVGIQFIKSFRKRNILNNISTYSTQSYKNRIVQQNYIFSKSTGYIICWQHSFHIAMCNNLYPAHKFSQPVPAGSVQPFDSSYERK